MRTDLILTAFALVVSAQAIAAPHPDNLIDLDEGQVYLVSSNKAYKLIDGLVSNEWVPLCADGYVDDYEQSDKHRIIKAANASLKRIRGD